MIIDNKKLLIGAGVVVVGYLLLKKSENKKSTNQVLLGVPKDAFVDKFGQPKLNINPSDFKNPFGATTPKIILGATNNVITPNNTQGATRVVNDIAIDKLPNIVNQEDIQLFFFNNSNISSIEGNTIRDAKGYPIYTRLRKSYIQKDALGNIVSGEANEGSFYKENGKFYIRTPYSYGSETCEISESDYIEFFINIKDGSYKKISSPSIKRINCKSTFNGGSWK